MLTKIKNFSFHQGVEIPEKLLHRLGWQVGDTVQLKVVGNTLVIQKVNRININAGVIIHTDDFDDDEENVIKLDRMLFDS